MEKLMTNQCRIVYECLHTLDEPCVHYSPKDDNENQCQYMDSMGRCDSTVAKVNALHVSLYKETE